MRNFRQVVVVALLLTGCASHRASSARLTEHEAVQIAMVVAQKAGERLDAHQAPHATFDSTAKQWSVFWNHKLPGSPGGYISVLVDDKTGVGKLLPSD
jgi:hypothetical protein